MIEPGQIVTPEMKDEALWMYWDCGFAFQLRSKEKRGTVKRLWRDVEPAGEWQDFEYCVDFDSFETLDYRRHPDGRIREGYYTQPLMAGKHLEDTMTVTVTQPKRLGFQPKVGK